MNSPGRTARRPGLARPRRRTNARQSRRRTRRSRPGTPRPRPARGRRRPGRRPRRWSRAAFAQTRNALEAQRVLSVLLNQRLLSIQGTQGVREELIRTTLTGLEATIASLEKLGTVARDKEGFALATRTLAGINQRAGQIAMEYGRYDETARYFRRMEELSEELAAADPAALEPLKVKASVKATLGDFQMDQIGDAEAALKHFDQALAFRRQWLAREPSNDDAKRGVANILGAIARARLKVGDPARARDMYREEVELRDQLSPAAAEQVEARRERAGFRDKLGDLSVSLGDPKAGREHFQQALELRREIAAQNPDENQARRDVLLSLEKLGNHELIYSRDPKAARRYYREALDGFLERLEAEKASVLARMDVALRITMSPRPNFARAIATPRWPITASAATSAKCWPRTRRPSSIPWT